MMKRLILFLSAALLATSFALAQDYKMEPVATAAPGLPAAYASLIQTQGYRVAGPSGPWCEVWFQKQMPTGPKSSDDSVTLAIPQGALIGIIRFPGQGADRRGQVIKPGVYTLRYSDYPVDGAHQGVAPQRDFALLTPIANDADPAAAPDFDALVKMSVKASGTPHPAVLSLESPSGSTTTFPAFAKEGDSDWVLSVKIGDLPLSIILVGKTQAG
jgi:hypothetical protein